MGKEITKYNVYSDGRVSTFHFRKLLVYFYVYVIYNPNIIH